MRNKLQLITCSMHALTKLNIRNTVFSNDLEIFRQHIAPQICFGMIRVKTSDFGDAIMLTTFSKFWRRFVDERTNIFSPTFVTNLVATNKTMRKVSSESGRRRGDSDVGDIAMSMTLLWWLIWDVGESLCWRLFSLCY